MLTFLKESTYDVSFHTDTPDVRTNNLSQIEWQVDTTDSSRDVGDYIWQVNVVRDPENYGLGFVDYQYTISDGLGAVFYNHSIYRPNLQYWKNYLEDKNVLRSSSRTIDIADTYVDVERGSNNTSLEYDITGWDRNGNKVDETLRATTIGVLYIPGPIVEIFTAERVETFENGESIDMSIYSSQGTLINLKASYASGNTQFTTDDVEFRGNAPRNMIIHGEDLRQSDDYGKIVYHANRRWPGSYIKPQSVINELEPNLESSESYIYIGEVFRNDHNWIESQASQSENPFGVRYRWTCHTIPSVEGYSSIKLRAMEYSLNGNRPEGWNNISLNTTTENCNTGKVIEKLNQQYNGINTSMTTRKLVGMILADPALAGEPLWSERRCNFNTAVDCNQ